MTNKLNLIKLPRGKGKEIAKVIGCTPAKVSQALNGVPPHNKLAEKIRYVALKEFNGVELESVKR